MWHCLVVLVQGCSNYALVKIGHTQGSPVLHERYRKNFELFLSETDLSFSLCPTNLTKDAQHGLGRFAWMELYLCRTSCISLPDHITNQIAKVSDPGPSWPSCFMFPPHRVWVG